MDVQKWIKKSRYNFYISIKLYKSGEEVVNTTYFPTSSCLSVVWKMVYDELIDFWQSHLVFWCIANCETYQARITGKYKTKY